MKPFKMKQVISGIKYDTEKAVIIAIKYDTEKAVIIADDCYWDGHNMDRRGRNTYLYKTPNGRYFATYLTLWQGERDICHAID